MDFRGFLERKVRLRNEIESLDLDSNGGIGGRDVVKLVGGFGLR